MTANEQYIELVGHYPQTPYAGYDRIDSACFIDGNDDEYIVEFWASPDRIMRTCYNRRTTCTERTQVDPYCWQYVQLRRWADATFYAI